MAKNTNNIDNSLSLWCKLNNRLDLLEEWDPSNEVSPNQVSHGSHMSVKWICKNDHHYEKEIHSRCRGTGCSICSGRLFHHRKALFEEYPALIGELDNNKNSYDSLKKITCCSSKSIYWLCEKGHSYEMSALNKIKSKGCPICNNKRVQRGINDLETWCKENSRLQILEDWDYSKNSVTPVELTYGSNQKIWFKCHICGYEWKTVINSRTYQHSDCRMCSRRVNSSFPEQCIFYYLSAYYPDTINGDRNILEGYELDVWVPSLNFAIEYDGKIWHSDKNKDIDKDRLCNEKGIVLYRIREKGSNILDSEHSLSFEYEYGDWPSLSSIITEILLDTGMQNVDVNIQRDEYVIKERYYKQSLNNSLKKLYPELSKEWHPTKNGNITPDLVQPETHDRYFWICKLGHTYQASPKNRVRLKSGCPYCANQKILKGFNDLETTHPIIALDYNNEKNLRKSYEVSKGCSDFVWLKCHKCGYEFYYQLSTYVSRGGLCPVCSPNGKTKYQKVLKYETMELFDTLPQAAESISNNKENNVRIYKCINKVCCGKAVTAYGFHWFYVSVDKDNKIIDDIDSLVVKNVDKHIVGQQNVMKNGQTATVIRDGGSTDIDIQFEDGTIVHTKRQSFKNGIVRNPNFIKKQKLFKSNDDDNGQTTNVQNHNHNDINALFESKKNNSYIKERQKENGLLGVSMTMKSGENARCVRDEGWNNIDIQFEDDTLVKNISRRNFLNGTVKNPNAINSFLGKKKTMNCGLTCTIIKIVSQNDISVQFDNGDIVSNTSLLKFKKGTIITNAMSHNFKHITGQRQMMNCGLYATVIADRGAHDIDVQFDDGTIVYNKDRSNFNKGNIGFPKSTSILGMTRVMNNGLSATVIADNGWDDIDVQFENGTIVKHKRRDHFKGGRIKC